MQSEKSRAEHNKYHRELQYMNRHLDPSYRLKENMRIAEWRKTNPGKKYVLRNSLAQSERASLLRRIFTLGRVIAWKHKLGEKASPFLLSKFISYIDLYEMRHVRKEKKMLPKHYFDKLERKPW